MFQGYAAKSRNRENLTQFKEIALINNCINLRSLKSILLLNSDALFQIRPALKVHTARYRQAILRPSVKATP